MISDDPSSDIYIYFDRVVTPILQARLQQAVSRSVDLTQLSTVKLLNYFNYVMLGLQTYGFWSSVILYSDNVANRNSAFYLMRSNFTADDIQAWTNLGRTLRGLPIPPNMRLLMQWVSQNFKSGPLPGNAITKVCPNDVRQVGTSNIYIPTPSDITDIIGKINSTSETFQLLSSACRNWIDYETLPIGSAFSCYDSGFKTFFINSPINVIDTTTATVRGWPQVTEVPIGYASATNELDGLIQSLFTMYNKTNGSWLPTLYQPNTSPWSNNYAYNRWYYKDSSEGFVPITDGSGSHLCEYVYVNNNNDAGSGNVFVSYPSCAQPILGISEQSVLDVAKQGVEWLISIDTIGTTPSRNIYPYMDGNRVVDDKSGKGKRRNKRSK